MTKVKHLCVIFGAIVLMMGSASAATISVNFYATDASNPDDHILTGPEAAGLDGNINWNNINIGAPGLHGTAGTIFSSTVLTDDTGNTTAATIAPSADSTWFVGHAASAATGGTGAQELGLAGNDDDLFNSYLGLGSADAAVLNITGLGSAYTSGGYTVIIYSDTDKRPASGTTVRQSLFTLTPQGGSAVTAFTEDDYNSAAPVTNTFSGTYIPSDNVDTGYDYSNFTVFSNLTASSFTLAIASPDGGRGGINGFQIVSGIVVAGPAPVIHAFSANTHVVNTNGTTVTLSWNVSNAETLSISPGIGNVLPVTVSGLGQTSIVVNAAATYTLTASNATASVSSNLSLHLTINKPNILLVLVDDYGPMDTSVPFVYNRYDDTGTPVITAFNKFYHTPNMETLASRGMKFTQAYAMPMCSPTRVTLMTGLNSPRHGVTVHLNLAGTIDNPSFTVPSERGPNNWRYHGMDASDVTLPQLLGKAGYRTIICGKGHLGTKGQYADDPRAIGFDINIGASAAGQPGSYLPGYSSSSYTVPGLEAYYGTGTFLTDALTQEMNKSIAQAVADGVPFFGYMSYYAVHTPLATDPNATNNYSGAVSTSHQKFATMVEGVDISLGDILAKLAELGVAENTLIVFLGDNGSDSPALTDEGYPASAFRDYPMRGKKGSTYEGGTRVPLIVSWASPNSSNCFQQSLPIAGGSVEHDLVAVEDIAPTILAAAGVAAPDMDGYDLGPYLRSESGTHRPQKILRYMPHEHRSNYFFWYREGAWKIIYRFPDNSFELYNLVDDPGESDDLASAQPRRVLTLARTMARELDHSWGIYGKLWPTRNPTQVAVPARPLEADPFMIPFDVDGRGAIDSDGDDLPDAQEDPDADGLVGASETDPDDADTDHDGSDDHTEIRLNLDPRNAYEAFRAQMANAGASSLTLSWPSAPGTTFNILKNTNLLDAVERWSVAVSNIPAAAASRTTSQAVGISDQDTGFFRVELRP